MSGTTRTQPASETSRIAEVASRMDRLPPSWHVWRMVILLSLGGVFEFYDLFFTGYVAPGMVKSGLFSAASLGPLAALHVISLAGFGVLPCSFLASLTMRLRSARSFRKDLAST